MQAKAALLELFDRLPGSLRKDVEALLKEDDPISRLRAQLAAAHPTSSK